MRVVARASGLRAGETAGTTVGLFTGAATGFEAAVELFEVTTGVRVLLLATGCEVRGFLVAGLSLLGGVGAVVNVTVMALDETAAECVALLGCDGGVFDPLLASFSAFTTTGAGFGATAAGLAAGTIGDGELLACVGGGVLAFVSTALSLTEVAGTDFTGAFAAAGAAAVACAARIA
ncbi:MAG: hypothetical protein WBP79_08555 [Candidatus Acidiferrales bacterium]